MKPELLFERFAEIRRVPRESGNEAGMTVYLETFARERGFASKTDSNGTVVIDVPARGTGTGKDTVVLQSHTDMVCVKGPGSNHDFTRDPIEVRVEMRKDHGVLQEVLLANNTTLGADNGMGVAAALAAATDPAVVNCPPLELLFTVDEERGLTGAGRLDPSLISGRYLINMDSEELGEICISCAGGRDLTAVWPIHRHPAKPEHVPMTIGLAGLPGGHSGVQINEGRGNAIAMLLHEVLRAAGGGPFELAELTGGSKRNVIPSTAEITLFAEPNTASALAASLASPETLASVRAQVKVGSDLVSITVSHPDRSATPNPISVEATQSILNSIVALPWGPQRMSDIVPGLVETSNNVAVVSTSESEITLCCSTRSSAAGAIVAFQDSQAPVLTASGAVVSHSDGYPGWEADAENPLLKTAETTFERVLGAKPKITAIHAGLECGVLKGIIPDLRMISFGPDILDAHTILERVLLKSVPPFYECLIELLADLCA